MRTPAPTLCEGIQRNVKWVWSELRKSSALSCSLGEESLTDFFVLKFLHAKPRGFCIRTFTRREEARTGSDWEWWVGSRAGGWIGMRIQAKTINVVTRKYDHIHYAPGGTAQVDKLIDDANLYELIPIYCLYTYWEETIHKYILEPRRKRDYGVSWIPATAVKHDSKKHTALSYWFHRMAPLAQLLCFDSATYPSFARGVFANLVQHNIIGDNDIDVYGQRWIRGELPDHVVASLSSRRARVDLEAV